jgi:hypothetical protein
MDPSLGGRINSQQSRTSWDTSHYGQKPPGFDSPVPNTNQPVPLPTDVREREATAYVSV